MSPHTFQFMAFSLFGLVSLALGYAVRRRRWLHEDLSRPIHFHTVTWVWSLAILLSLWRIPIRPENLWLLAVQPLLMIVTAYGSIPLIRILGCDKSQTGVMAIAAGLSNNGFTMGAYLCYCLLHPAQQALAYGLAITSIMSAATVVVLYPLARHYGQQPEEAGSLLQLILRSYLDLRAMSLYTAVLGVVLAIVDAPFPAFIDRWHLVDVLFYLGAFGGYFGIGLRLHLGRSASYRKHHVFTAGLKFVVTPVLAWGVLYLVNATPWPLDPLATNVVLIEAAMPTAIALVILANLFHLDVRMASVLWLWNTLLFVALPLPVIFWVWG